MTETHRFGRRLKEGRWTVRDAGNLQRVIARAAESEAQWQGIAYTTAGARALRSISEGELLGTDGERIQHNTVYELRLWSVIAKGGEGDDVLARELRWLNGTGSAEVAVLRADGAGDGAATGAAAGAEACWYRPNAYLQHDDGEKDPREMPAMESIEVFIEAEYGNTVFVDELMTGEWKRNG